MTSLYLDNWTIKFAFIWDNLSCLVNWGKSLTGFLEKNLPFTWEKMEREVSACSPGFQHDGNCNHFFLIRTTDGLVMARGGKERTKCPESFKVWLQLLFWKSLQKGLNGEPGSSIQPFRFGCSVLIGQCRRNLHSWCLCCICIVPEEMMSFFRAQAGIFQKNKIHT